MRGGSGLKEEVEAGMLVVGLGEAEQLVVVALLEQAIRMQKLLAMPMGFPSVQETVTAHLCRAARTRMERSTASRSTAVL